MHTAGRMGRMFQIIVVDRRTFHPPTGAVTVALMAFDQCTRMRALSRLTEGFPTCSASTQHTHTHTKTRAQTPHPAIHPSFAMHRHAIEWLVCAGW